jgi:hypothetical protein
VVELQIKVLLMTAGDFVVTVMVVGIGSKPPIRLLVNNPHLDINTRPSSWALS